MEFPIKYRGVIMALFIDGFEQFDKMADAGAEMRLAGYSVMGSVTTATGRKSGRSLVLTGSSISRAAPWAGNLFTVGFAVRFAARGPLLQMTGGVVLTLNKDTGRPMIGDVAGNAGPVKDRWYYVEMLLNRSDRTVTLFLNGKADMTVTMPEEMAAETSIGARLNPFDAVNDGTGGGTRTYDDFYMRDGDRLGPMQITTRFPTEDAVPNEWAPSEGPTAEHWSMVGVLPIDKLDKYLIANVSNAEESFKSSTKLPDNNKVVALGMVTLIRKTTIDDLYITARFDGRDVDVRDVPMDWRYRYSQFPVDGDTKSSIEGAEFGAVLRRIIS